jgi:hypothetical protein
MIGMAGINDRHAPESVIGMARIMHIERRVSWQETVKPKESVSGSM